MRMKHLDNLFTCGKSLSIFLSCRVLFSGLAGRGLWLKSLLDVLPPSMCGILRSDPSGSEMNSHWSCFVPFEHSVFHTAVGGGSWSPTLLMPLSLKSFFFLLASGLLLLLLPRMLLELSSLVHGQSVWSYRMLYSWASPCPCCCAWCWLACMAGWPVFWILMLFLIGHGLVLKFSGLLKCMAWFYMHWEPDTRTS